MYDWIHSLPPDRYVIGDSGFAITPKLIVPYSESQKAFDPFDRGMFNYQLSKIRVRIEQTFGLIKRIFPFLGFAKLCNDFNKHTDTTESLFVLFNIFLEIGAINTDNLQNTINMYAAFNVNDHQDVGLEDGNPQSSPDTYPYVNYSDDRIRRDGKASREVLINQFI